MDFTSESLKTSRLLYVHLPKNLMISQFLTLYFIIKEVIIDKPD